MEHPQISTRLHVGDRVKFAEEAQRYTVRAVTRGGRFAILTKPFNPRRTVLYTVIDFERGHRGTDNYRGLGYETDEQVADALHEFQHAEDGTGEDECERDDQEIWCHGGAKVSWRTANYVPVRIEETRPAERPGGDA